jgi:hypothetical protein
LTLPSSPYMDDMNRSPRTNRTLRRFLFIGGAIALVVAGRRFGWHVGPAPGSATEPEPPTASGVTPPPPPARLRRPPSAVAELGVLTDRPEAELATLLDRASLGALLTPAQCGDEAACAAVRSALADEHTTTLQVVAADAWNLAGIDLDASAAGLPPRVRASVTKRARIVVVHVAASPSPRQIAIRTAFAVAAAIADKTDGLVYDQLLGRIEGPRDFEVHAIDAPLDTPAFRKDRIELLYEPKETGVVRILTAGLSRWGGPDVEAAAVPVATADRVADVVLAVAEAIANGAATGPVMLSRDDLSRARGEPYPPDPSLPEAKPMAIDLASVHPEGGDPNDFMARIEPAGGEGPLGYLDLSERFFGSSLAASPGEASLRASRDKAQRALPAALAHWSATRPGGSLLVRLPFDIAGECDAGADAGCGTESMWIDVTGYDARTIRGKLVDDPLGATQFNRGDAIARPRTDVEAIEARDRPGP